MCSLSSLDSSYTNIHTYQKFIELDSLKICIQLTLKQHEFELHGSAYICGFFSLNRGFRLHKPGLVESADGKTADKEG